MTHQFSFGQHNGPWLSFTDTTQELSGYKDLKGNITIPPKFGGFTRADTFYNIIAVHEPADSAYLAYYLLKDGRKVGRDSVFVFDYTFDCESEGKIRFSSQKNDRVGFLDKNGVVIIPAVYNYASPFRNGLAIAHRNARRKCWGPGEDTTHCEHPGWEGGETILINEKNEILADSVNVNLSRINWYSKRINDPSVDTSVFVSIKGRNETIYSVIDFEKEFNQWFYTVFLPGLHAKDELTLKNYCFPEVTFWSEKNGWTRLPKDPFLKAFPKAISRERFGKSKAKHISIGQGQLNPFIFERNLYNRFYNACGEHQQERFPVFTVMLTYYKKRAKPLPDPSPTSGKNYERKLYEFGQAPGINYQEHFEFLRTEAGYRLLSVSIRSLR